MSNFSTPRRRHSSLFQRMEDEINKISRKLSAAKENLHSKAESLSARPSYQAHKYHLTQDLYSVKKKYLKEQGTIETVRRNKNNDLLPAQSTQKYCNFTEQFNKNNLTPKQPLRRLRLSAAQTPHLNDSQQKGKKGNSSEIDKLIEQNNVLSVRLSEIESVCKEQAYKIGYLKAQNREKKKECSKIRRGFTEEKVYLTKLVEGYKIKSEKYKHILNLEDSIEITIDDLR